MIGRDYVALLKQFIPEEQIYVIKITEIFGPRRHGKK